MRCNRACTRRLWYGGRGHSVSRWKSSHRGISGNLKRPIDSRNSRLRSTRRPAKPYHATRTEERAAMELLERDQHLDHLDEHAAPGRRGAGAHGARWRRSRGWQDHAGRGVLPPDRGTAAVLRTSCDALSTPGPLGPVRDLAPALGLQIDRARPRGRRPGSALSGGARGPRRPTGTDGRHRRRRPLGRRRHARVAPLPRPADWRTPRPLRRHLPRRRDRGRSSPPSGPRRSGDGASRPSHQRPPVVGRGGAAIGRGQRPRRRRPCTG